MAVLGRELLSRLKDVVVQARDVDEAGSRMALEWPVVQASTDSVTSWAEIKDKLKTLRDKMNLAKKRLNREIAQAMTRELLTDIEPNDEVRTWLRAIGEALEAD